ncbi:uncharacterized protein [Panulirus ornatus]|uniref:uncharacterized protein n=1 Tax=Panulirus ornatus TaxID=150431 RepID=UPI003A880160
MYLMHWRRANRGGGGGDGRGVGNAGLVVVLAVMTFVVGSSLAQNVGMFRLAGVDKKFAGPLSTNRRTLVLLTWSSSLIACAAYCRSQEPCLAFNYHRVHGTCEHLGSAWLENDNPMLQDHPGWDYYTQHYPNLPSVVDPCRSNPCEADSVCVRYLQPIHQKYRYDLDFYMCTRHHWYLEEHSAGRTVCTHRIVYDLDYRGFDIAPYAGVYAPVQDAFKKCVEHDCAALLCLNVNDDEVRCWMKTAFDDVKEKAVVSNGFVFWYPECH